MSSRTSVAKILHSSKWWTSTGIFLFILGMYVFSSPGRIDLIDGQVRFDVSFNWLTKGRPMLGDPWITPYMGVPGRDGRAYSYYGAPASAFALPLVWLGGVEKVTSLERSRFLFSMTSPIFGALIAVVLFLFYTELEIPLKQAVTWTLVSAFATLIWPVSNSSFDNAQHAFFALVGMYVGFLSAKMDSKALAIWGGLLAGVLVLYQLYFVLIIPSLAISTLNWTPAAPLSPSPVVRTSKFLRFFSKAGSILPRPFALFRSALRSSGQARESSLRFVCFLFAVSVDLALYFIYNNVRFGSYLDDGKLRMELHRPFPLLGNPIAGMLTLLVSPGKSIFLYSPPLILAILGMRYLHRRSPAVAFGILTSSVTLVLFISCISYAGGDWCWGPRYLVAVLPLWSLAFPFFTLTSVRRKLIQVIVALGLCVQILGLSVDHQRFFFENKLDDYFWAEDSWAYFKHSALFARVGETISLRDGPPATARWFNALPVPDWATYSPLGPPVDVPRSAAPIWIKNFKVFFLPRPWPLWMLWIKPELRPINLQSWILSLMAIITMGVTLVYRGLRNSLLPHTGQNIALSEELAHT